MAEWKKMESPKGGIMPYYITELGDMKLSLSVPYENGPWSCRLTVGPKTVHKDYFRLRSKMTEDTAKENWETPDDLEKAQAEAFQIMRNYFRRYKAYWENLEKNLNSLEQEGKGGKDDREEE